MVASIKHYFSTFLLWNCSKGLSLTGRYLFARKITVQFPEERTTEPAFSRLHALRRYENGESDALPVNCARAVCPAMAITIRVVRSGRWQPSHYPLRH